VEAFELQEVSYHIYVLSIRPYRLFGPCIQGWSQLHEARGHLVHAMAQSSGSRVLSTAPRTRQVLLCVARMDQSRVD
jgi:hypothetical protein